MEQLAPFTQYPVVLVHGLFGFEKVSGYSYFYKIDTALRALGVIVYVPIVSAAHTTEQRGEQLIETLQALAKSDCIEKFNLIGHSQGALTARYMAAKHPELVASVTSVNGVNHGSEVADMVLKALRRDLPAKLADRIVKGFIKLMTLISNKPQLPQDFMGALHSLSTKGVALFNEHYPFGLPKVWGGEGKELESNGVYYYSWSSILNSDTNKKRKARFIPLHLMARLSSYLFYNEKEQNDGFVGRFSSHLGRVIASDYAMDHFDAVNQVAGFLSSTVDPVALYIEHAYRLQEKGL